jgi:hypothetical protein
LSPTDGTLERRPWELGFAVAVRDGWRSGEVLLPARRRHGSLTNLVYAPTRWQHDRDDASPALQLPQEPDDVCARLQRECDEVAQQAERGLARNPLATIRDNRLPLKRREALERPPQLTQLRHTSEGALPRGRSEDLLMQVDTWCDCPRAFRHPGDRAPPVPNFCTTLLATLMAHGTHWGLATMAQSVEGGITAEMLQELSQWCLREATRKAAHAILVTFHPRLPLSAVWGDGAVSSSAGQRFGLQASALLGALSPRYLGSYDQALTVYTPSADPHSVLHTQVIACSGREAIDVLDGL